jgi:hypothetical protein
MKYLIILFFIILSSCTKLELNHCYFNHDYSSAYKVTKVESYGVYLKAIKRPPVVGLICENASKEQEYYIDNVTASTFFEENKLVEIDCEAYDKIEESAKK